MLRWFNSFLKGGVCEPDREFILKISQVKRDFWELYREHPELIGVVRENSVYLSKERPVELARYITVVVTDMRGDLAKSLLAKETYQQIPLRITTKYQRGDDLLFGRGSNTFKEEEK